MANPAPIIATSKRSHGLAIAWTRCELLLEQTLGLLAEATRTYDAHDNALDVTRLEPRILLSATPIAPIVVADAVMLIGSDVPSMPVVAVTPANQESASNLSPTQKDSQRTELIVVDPRSADSNERFDDHVGSFTMVGPAASDHGYHYQRRR